MAIPTTDLDIGTRYALQEDFNKGFVGRDRQVVIQTDDPKGYRPVIMDGTTQGGKSKVALVADLSDYVSVSTYNSDKADFVTTSTLTSSLATKANTSHTHAQSDVTGLSDALAGKAAVSHTHTKSDVTDFAHTHATSEVTGLATALASKANTSHTHAQSDVTGLSDALAGKAAVSHTHTKSDVTDFAHTHATSEVTGLATALASKADTSVVSTKISKAGSRGVLQGYETLTQSSGNAVTIGYSTGDYIVHDAKNQTVVTITVDGSNIADLPTAGGVKVLFMYNMFNVKRLTVQGANGITRIDWEGDGAPSLNGKSTARLVFQLHDITASISIKQWS